MLTDQKIQQILRHVWNPQIDSTNPDHTKIISLLIPKIYDLLESRDGSQEALNEFLKKASIQKFNAEVSTEKSLETSKLIMSWYAPIPMRWTDFGKVKIQKSNSSFFEQDYFVYQTNNVNEFIPFDYINQGEIIIYFEKIDLPEAEKLQLIDAIREMIKPLKLTFFDAP